MDFGFKINSGKLDLKTEIEFGAGNSDSQLLEESLKRFTQEVEGAAMFHDSFSQNSDL